MGPKLGFLTFSQVWFISFPLIAQDVTLEQCLTTSRGKTHEKVFGAKILAKRAKIGTKITVFPIFSSLVN